MEQGFARRVKQLGFYTFLGIHCESAMFARRVKQLGFYT